MPTVLSTFSGVGGLDEGLRRAGWDHVGMCERDPYRRAVLAERFPGVPIWDDVRVVATGAEPAWAGGGRSAGTGRDGEHKGLRWGFQQELHPHLLCGGFPCQDLSVAGRREGLAGERSGLFFEFARIAESVRPEWLLIENVPGLLSSNGGRDFGELLGTLADIGYGVAWRILDSRFFGVPQRRRRVFIVAHHLGGRAGAERAGAVLAVGSGCGGHPAPGGEAGPDVAYRSGESPDFVGGVVNALDRMAGGPDDNAAQAGHLVPTSFHLLQDPVHSTGATHAMSKGSKQGAASLGVMEGSSVRRLTPRECERLQGFPDDWTLIEWQGKPAADSRRYAACGDAVTVPVAEWLGRRIAGAA